ncbi:15837_t:CDS:2 [Acaulospora colombiana]|uniref:15837_t:CDS:1 n=1 Tax=Acaulospora colombiana TaxID=27376 RepID=A0ACA9LET4_9GLOM|nr:15837_t:CDS:2 [Acaulospora colombiana]
MPLSPPPSSQPTKPKSALDVAVNKLVRASVGGVPSTICDEDLDKYVAELILKEASEKNKLYNKEGIRAYLPNAGSPPCNAPKANKRFLFNFVKNVDDHNQALIKKTEEEAAARMRRLRRKLRGFPEDDEDEKYESNKNEHKGSRWDDHARRDYNDSNTDCESDDDDYSDMDTSSSSEEYVGKASLAGSSASNNTIIHKGRGEVSDGTKMDKYFREDYNPVNDIEPFIKENGWRLSPGDWAES